MRIPEQQSLVEIVVCCNTFVHFDYIVSLRVDRCVSCCRHNTSFERFTVCMSWCNHVNTLTVCQDVYFVPLVIPILLACGLYFSSILLIVLALICCGVYFLYLHTLCENNRNSCALLQIFPILFASMFVLLVWAIYWFGYHFYPPYGGYLSLIVLSFACIFTNDKRCNQNFCSPEYSDVEARPNKEKVTYTFKEPPSISISTVAQQENSDPSTTASVNEITPIVNTTKGYSTVDYAHETIVNTTKDYSTVEYAHESQISRGVSTPCCCVSYGVVKNK